MKSLSHYFSKELATPMIPPVLFFCNVSGEPMTAYFNGMVNDSLFYCFRVTFSNGYEDDFTLLENGFVEGEHKTASTAYALAIKDDLHVLIHFSADKEIYTLRWIINTIQCNVWVIESATGNERIYKVCYHSHYQFQIKKAGAGWLTTNVKDTDPLHIDARLAAEIGRMIDRERGQD